MSKFFRGLLAVSLCFCMICSICGVGFAVDRYTDPAYWEMIGESPPPDVSVDPAESPPADPVPDESPSAEPVASAEPDPVESLYVDPNPEYPPESNPPGWLPGGDTPAYDWDDLFGPGGLLTNDAEPDPSEPVLVAPSGDATYIELPDDYVIKSASLDESYAIDPQSALAPVTPANTSGLKSVMLSILGNYDPIVAEYQYVNNGSYANYVREIQPDYVWLASAAIFAILLYCTWRILGGLVCRK